MDTEVFNSAGLSGRIEPASLEKQIGQPEVRSRQVLATEAPSFA